MKRETGKFNRNGYISHILAYLLSGLVRFYQLAVSPHLPKVCRYMPTCSDYALEALRRFGFWRGSYLALRRILRCHPWAKGGWDPVPPAKHSAARFDKHPPTG